MDGGGELTGMIQIDPADAFVLRRVLNFVMRLNMDIVANRPAFERLYVQLGGDPANLK